MDLTVPTYVNTQYSQYEAQSKSKYNRKCIDGKITGCGNCVGYCVFDGHPGFLTEKLRTQHHCKSKKCFYYIEKPVRIRRGISNNNLISEILEKANNHSETLKGLKFLSATAVDTNSWQLKYITITNDYSLLPIKYSLEEEFECAFTFIRLNYDFDICAKLIIET